MNTQDRVYEEIRKAYNEREAKKVERSKISKEDIIAKAKKKAEQRKKIEKDALANSILNQIKEVVEGADKKKQQQAIISTRTPYDYGYDHAKRKAKDNE